MAEEHIESLEQQLADTEKKVTEANQKGNDFNAFFSVSFTEDSVVHAIT